MRILFLLSFLGYFFISCTKDRLEANGDVREETRRLSEFSGVMNSGSKKIHITYGEEFKVELRGSSNLLPRFKTEVQNRTLKVGYERVNVVDDDVEVYVTMPLIKDLTLSGSGKILLFRSFPLQDRCNFSISGSGDIKVDDSFDVNNLDLNISGSGNIDALEINAKEADVRISGSGDARLSAEDHLRARISGSGKIYYKGTPSVDSKVSGSGDIIKL